MNTSSNEDKHLESEIDVDNKSVNTKSAVLKNFHVALVEFVEELLRPTWNLGLLSKVAYKKIVKKTVNIVENSLHPNQIPNTAESTEEYFDLSLTKLSNTIEVRHKKFVCPLNSIVHNLTSNFSWEKILIYPSTLSFGADIPLVIKVAHICPYRYTNGSHIPLPLQQDSHIPFI